MLHLLIGQELPDYECHMATPIDLLEDLEKAQVHGSLLLVFLMNFLNINDSVSRYDMFRMGRGHSCPDNKRNIVGSN